MNAAITKPAPALLRLLEAVAKLRPTSKIQVPTGYQDENGFHYGEQPAKTTITWPPVR